MDYDDFIERICGRQRPERKKIDDILADFQRAEETMSLLVALGFTEEEIDNLNMNLFSVKERY